MSTDLSHSIVGVEEVDLTGELASNVARMTAEIFGQPATLREELDPETDQRSIAVAVLAPADASEIIKLDYEWHRALLAVAGDYSLQFQLDIQVE